MYESKLMRIQLTTTWLVWLEAGGILLSDYRLSFKEESTSFRLLGRVSQSYLSKSNFYRGYYSATRISPASLCVECQLPRRPGSSIVVAVEDKVAVPLRLEWLCW